MANQPLIICLFCQAAISYPNRQLLLRLADLGYFQRKISFHLNKRKADEKAGLTSQSVVSAMEDELTDYYRMIALMETQLSKENQPDPTSGLTLRRILVWMQDPLYRLKVMAEILEMCHGPQASLSFPLFLALSFLPSLLAVFSH